MLFPVRERYREQDSPLHQFDPRIKLVVALILVVGIILTPERSWPAYPMLWALVGSLAALGQLGVWRVGRAAGIVLPFTLAAATLLFTTPGTAVVSGFGLTITGTGIERAGAVMCKSWLAMQVMLILAMTTHFTAVLWALGWLRVPHTLVLIISFMYRYLIALQGEADRLMQARAARSGTTGGYKPGRSVVWRAQVAGGMVGSLFLRGYERSERTYAAMLARGFRGQLHRLDAPPLTGREVALGVVPVVILIIIQGLALLWV